MSEFPKTLIYGIDLLNRGEYFEAHEVIEAVWRAEPGEIRVLYQGILQVAVVYYHITRQNYVGARKVIKRAISNLSPFTENTLIDVPEIIRNLNSLDNNLETRHPGKSVDYSQVLLKPVRLRQ